MEPLYITILFLSVLKQTLPNFLRYQTAISLTDSSHEKSDIKDKTSYHNFHTAFVRSFEHLL
jgi:hypothetical protein